MPARKITVAAFVLLTLQLAACVAQPQMIWVSQNKGDPEFKADRYACLQSSAQATPPATATGRDLFGDPYQYDVNADTRDQLFSACMNAKGWTLQPAPQAPNVSVSG